MFEKLIISKNLIYLFKEFNSQLRINIDTAILATILRDFHDDQLNGKEYILNKTSIIIRCEVEEYEPETLNIEMINSNKKDQEIFSKLISDYKVSFGTGADYRDVNESILIFKNHVNS